MKYARAQRGHCGTAKTSLDRSGQNTSTLQRLARQACRASSINLTAPTLRAMTARCETITNRHHMDWDINEAVLHIISSALRRKYRFNNIRPPPVAQS